jgi:dephospho-CoA kinase
LEKIGENAKIRKIAITGTVSAGKSTVCEFLKTRGAFILQADNIVHNILLKNASIIQKIKEKFSDCVIKNGEIDRKLLADCVFSNSEKLKSLEDILHPEVIEIIKKTYDTIKDSPDYKAFVVEFPLLFEIEFEHFFDQVIFVTADEERRKNRFINKGFSEEQFKLRSKRMSSENEKISKSDFIIKNNGSLENLNNQIENIFVRTL